MNHFLVVFDRAHGELLLVERYETPRDAMRARFQSEQQYRDDPNMEVVVLGAKSLGALRVTHSRYFEGVRDLAEAGSDVVRRVSAAAC